MTTRKLAVIAAGLSNPSSTRMLADRLAEATESRLRERDIDVDVQVFELRDLAHSITNNMLTGTPTTSFKTRSTPSQAPTGSSP